MGSSRESLPMDVLASGKRVGQQPESRIGRQSLGRKKKESMKKVEKWSKMLKGSKQKIELRKKGLIWWVVLIWAFSNQL